MDILIAPQEFKGSLTAFEAAQAIAEGVRRAAPRARVEQLPLSDGGAGLVDVMLAARGGDRFQTDVHDPLMRPVCADWVRLADGTAVIEMAAASGLVLLKKRELDPLHATTYGTGELIAAARDRGCTRIVVGVGGSATVDAGAGAMQALGARLLDAAGGDLASGGAALMELDRIDLSARHSGLAGASIVVASDVTNTLCGEHGAARVFGPQKGATSDDVNMLDAALAHFAEIVLRDFGIDIRTAEGGGAAGGLGVGLMLVAGAMIVPGFAFVADALGLERRVALADVVITGEGTLDSQTAFGKTAAGVARMARAHGKRIGAVVGIVSPDFDPRGGLFDAIVSATPQGMPLDDAMTRARELVRDAARRIVPELGLRYSDRR